MVFFVAEEDPKPDNYIAIFVRKSREKDFDGKERFKLFASQEKALVFAQQLKEKYGISTIRLFYEEGHSRILRNTKK